MLLPKTTKLFKICNDGERFADLSSSKTPIISVKTSGKYILNSPSKARDTD